MKLYTIITKNDWDFLVQANNLKQAIEVGRRICRRTGDEFLLAKLYRKA
jgi:hypothetical protein